MRPCRIASSVALLSCAVATGARIASTSTMPTWRATSVRAASVRSRSGAERRAARGPCPRRRGSAARSSTPRSARAGTRAPHRRRRAAARRPSARACGGPGIAAAASAATGRTETPSAARSGEIAKPATSSITSRNSTAVNAAAVNASARERPRPAGLGVPVLGARVWRVGRCAHAHAAARASGTCTTKIARQSNTSVRTPPIAGPGGGADQRRAEPPAAARVRLARLQHLVGGEQRGRRAPTACSARKPSISHSDRRERAAHGRRPRTRAARQGPDAAAGPARHRPRGRARRRR